MQFSHFARHLPDYVTQRAHLALEDNNDAVIEATGCASYQTAMGFAIEIERVGERHAELEVVLRMDLAKFTADAQGQVSLSQLLLSLNGRTEPYRLAIADTHTVRALQNFKVEALSSDVLNEELDDFVKSALLMTALLCEYRDNRRESGSDFLIYSPDNFVDPMALKRAGSSPQSNKATALVPVGSRTLTEIQHCIEAEIDALGDGIPDIAFAYSMNALVDAFYGYRFPFDQAGLVFLRLGS